MNYKKIKEQLRKENLIDDNNLICHSNRSYTSPKSRVIYMELNRIGNDMRMPSFMLLSIKDDRLNISFAKGFGGFKKYYASFKLLNLKFQESFIADKIVNVYVFNVLDDDKKVAGKFFIITNQHKEDANNLVNYIIEYNKQNED